MSFVVIAPGVKHQCAISETAVTSAALPVMKHSENPVSSSGTMRRSTTSMPRRRARLMTVCRVMPSRKQSAFGNPPLPVEHHGVRVAQALGFVFGDGADHIEAGSLGAHGCGCGIRPPII